METKKLYLWGEWVGSANTLDVVFPYNGELIWKVSMAEKKHVDRAIELAEEGFKETLAMQPYERAEVLRYIVAELKKQRDDFSELLCLENGKTIKEARLEIDRTITTFEIAIWEAERVYGEYMNLWVNHMSVGRHGIVKKFPVGIVSGITPFNFPMNLAAHKIAPAMATGCPIIIKPASATPLTMLKLAEIIENSGWPKKAFSVVPSDRHVGQQLVEDERINLLSFTGSPHVGWKMKWECGKKKTVLELGWNAACIVDNEVADWDYVINRMFIGAYYQAGQTCISVQRIFIHEGVYDEFKKKFLAKLKTIKVGDPRLEETDIGGIIDQKNRDRLQDWIDDAIAKWAKLLAWNAWEGTLLEPTLLEDVSDDAILASEEAFGTVAVLQKYSDINEVVNMVNDSKFGLQVWIFSKDIDKIWKVFEGSHVGWVIQNDIPSFRVDSMPYGWVKDSGIGREWVKYAMEDMLEERVLVLKPE